MENGFLPRNIQIIFGLSFIILLVFTILIRGLQKKQHKSAGELMGRTQTFWGMLVLLFVAATTPLWVSYLFFGAISAAALYEYFAWQKASAKDLAKPDLKSQVFAFALIPVQLLLLYFEWPFAAMAVVPFSLVVFLPSLMVLSNRPHQVLATYGFLASGIVFFAFAFPMTAGLTRFGLMPLLLCFLLTELRDLISYWLGKYFAKQQIKDPASAFFQRMNYKIAPEVSPNKSWGVGIVSTMILILLAQAFGPLMPVSPQGVVPTSFMTLWGFSIGVIGLMGDLVFSLFKREFGLKDSGSLLPGNTGIIDRIDSLVLTVPTTYFLFHCLFTGWF